MRRTFHSEVEVEYIMDGQMTIGAMTMNGIMMITGRIIPNILLRRMGYAVPTRLTANGYSLIELTV